MSEAPVDNKVWTLGWRLRWSMERAGKSREQMAQECGVSPSTVSRWLHDEIVRPPNKLILNRWGAVTQVRVGWLLGHDPSPFLPPADEAEYPRLDSNQRPTTYKSHGSRRGALPMVA